MKSRLTTELLETFKDMYKSGLLTKAAYDKIIQDENQAKAPKSSK